VVGRPNVGKSTLFNRLTDTRDALVADYPGLTRDRLYGFSARSLQPAIVIDTGGLVESGDELAALMRRQVELAVAEADVVVMLADAQAGVTTEDRFVAGLVRRSGKPVVLAVNKSEGRDRDDVVAEFYELGLDTPHAVSASHGDGVRNLFAVAMGCCPMGAASDAVLPSEHAGPRITVVGRPNVGKSTLINRLLREDRLVTRDEPGTTRDAIRVAFEMHGKPYTLVDTAGVRRRARVTDTIEKFSVAKTLQAVEESDAVIMLLDAREGVTEQDASLIGLVLERGRALTLGINKWDGLTDGEKRRMLATISRDLPFLDFVEVHPVSALHGSNIQELFQSAARAATAARAELPTHELTRVLEEVVATHPPPLVRRHRIKLNYAHQGGRRPPLIVVHGNQTDLLPDSYRRYLVNRFRKAFKLTGTPIRLELRTGRNPFAGRRNPLTARQVQKRRRLREHSRR
jgi:GTP-binding protein